MSAKTVHTRLGEISYAESGGAGTRETTPAVLFVHGTGTNSRLWEPTMQLLDGDRRCLALDLPGHGGSPPADVLGLDGLAEVVGDFCDALGLARVHLVGNDSGGAVSQVLVARRPNLVTSLTLTNCDTADNLPPAAFAPTVDLARRGLLAELGRHALDDLSLARRGPLGQGHEHPDRLPDALLTDYLQPVFGTPSRARAFERLLASLDGQSLRAVEPTLGRLHIPTALVWGDADPFFPPDQARSLQRLIPSCAPVTWIRGGRLFFPYERPDELVGALNAQLVGLDASRSAGRRV